MIETFHLSDLPQNPLVEVIRKKSRRSMSIKLYPYKPIQVFTNFTMPMVDIQKFVHQKQDWISKHLKKFDEKIGPQVKLSLEPGKLFPLFGVWREFKVHPTFQNKIYFEVHPTEIRLFLPRSYSLVKDTQKIEKTMIEFYKQTAVQHLPQRVAVWGSQIGLKPSRLEFRRPKGRWGSCTSRGVVTLNWKLICLPENLIDYVIAHELCHLKYMNHSKDFWAMLDSFIPQRKFLESRLDELQFVTDFLA